MSNIIGHKRQQEYFSKILSKGVFSHAYLFYGPAHVGKRMFAEEVAKGLLCEKGRRVLGGCGTCRSCERVASGAHENVVRLGREETLVSKKEKRKEIPIEDIRELRRMASFAVSRDSWRVVIIDEAERMSQEAANAFLKLLEEPPQRTVFFLITSELESMLATIRSRTQGVYFSPVREADIQAFLESEKIPSGRKEEIIRAADNRPGIAVSFVRSEEEFSRGEKRARGVADALRQGVPFFFPFAESVSRDDDERCRVLEEVVRIMRRRLQDAEDPVGRMGIARRIKAIVRISDVMARTNVNPRLSMDRIFFEGSEKME